MAWPETDAIVTKMSKKTSAKFLMRKFPSKSIDNQALTDRETRKTQTQFTHKPNSSNNVLPVLGILEKSVYCVLSVVCVSMCVCLVRAEQGRRREERKRWTE